MKPEIGKPTEEQHALLRGRQALRLVSADLPHLAGLAHLVRMKATNKVAVAAVADSGLVLLNPSVFASVPLADAAYVLAHELMHLALNTHGRGEGAAPLAVNFAHDYIINDMLSAEMGRLPPLDGLYEENARTISLEEMVTRMRKNPNPKRRCWSQSGGTGRDDESDSPMGIALREAGLLPPKPKIPDLPPDIARGDLLPRDREPDFEPEISPSLRDQLRNAVRKAAAKAASLGALQEQMKEAEKGQPIEPQRGEAMIHAVELGYAPPWQLALQRWMDAVAPGPRSYARPSRRGGADRTDVALPGRTREGWALHILLDTSGSMEQVLPKTLGAIASFCDASNVAQVHVIQCDIEVTHDDWLEPSELLEYRVAGFGGSDMSPGIRYFANDPEVMSVLVLTDGYISFPADEPPYQVLWGLIGDYADAFDPPYGDVIKMKLE